MKIAVVDDEYYALEGLRIKLSEIDGVELVGMYESSELFLKEIDETRPDLVLLDIEMPKLNGFQVQARLKEIGAPNQVIFVTAYSHYEKQIGESDAIDYIMKPVAREKLEQVLAAPAKAK